MLVRHRFVCLCCLVLLLATACASQIEDPVPPTPTISSVATTTMPVPPSETPTATVVLATAVPPATATSVITPTVEPAPPTPIIASTLPLAPLQALADEEIVDRPLRNIHPVTDGERLYRLAAWAPNAPYVALTPQDGPGLDLVDLRTGAVTAVVTSTYVLEPQWTDDGALLVHRTDAGVDSLWRYLPGDGFEAEPLVEWRPLSAPSHAGGMLAFSSDGNLLVCSIRCTESPRIPQSKAALFTAPAPAGQSQGLLAWTPVVTDLEDVQTLVAPISMEPEAQPAVPWVLGASGEGLWLPRWSPDGSRVALTSIEGRIAVAAVDGSVRYDLGPGDTPAWSPDSTLIAYAGASAGLEYTTRNLHLVRADGGGQRIRMTVANEAQFFISPTWSPDGKQLAFVELDSGQLFVGDVPLP